MHNLIWSSDVDLRINVLDTLFFHWHTISWSIRDATEKTPPFDLMYTSKQSMWSILFIHCIKHVGLPLNYVSLCFDVFLR